MEKKTGIELIAKERQEQIEKHGYTVQHDQQYKYNELVRAACVILDPEHNDANDWPWQSERGLKIYHNIINKSWVERCAIVGAFMAAEIDVKQAQ